MSSSNIFLALSTNIFQFFLSKHWITLLFLVSPLFFFHLYPSRVIFKHPSSSHNLLIRICDTFYKREEKKVTERGHGNKGEINSTSSEQEKLYCHIFFQRKVGNWHGNHAEMISLWMCMIRGRLRMRIRIRKLGRKRRLSAS